jgi:uncharacterized membrane protein YciS (DUF1049 family)
MDSLLERMKKMIEVLKMVVMYIVLPVGAVISYILYLRSKVSDLKLQNTQTKVETELANVLEKQVEVDARATDAVAEYERIKKEYLGR